MFQVTTASFQQNFKDKIFEVKQLSNLEMFENWKLQNIDYKCNIYLFNNYFVDCIVTLSPYSLNIKSNKLMFSLL